MKHFTKSRGFIFGTVFVALVSLGYARPAHASGSFPAELQKTLDKRFPGTTFCVPLCTACHLTTVGGPFMFNVFGQNLYDKGGLKFPSPAAVDGAVNTVLNLNLDSDGDGITDNDELKLLESPSGPGAFCTDITYGCGARIASAPPPIDKVGLFSAGLVVLGLTLLRRRRR